MLFTVIWWKTIKNTTQVRTGKPCQRGSKIREREAVRALLATFSFSWGNGLSCTLSFRPPSASPDTHHLAKLLCVCGPSSEKLLLSRQLLPESAGLQRKHWFSVPSPCLMPLACGRGSGQLPESECGDKGRQKGFGRRRYSVTLGTSKESNVLTVMLACDTKGQHRANSTIQPQFIPTVGNDWNKHSVKKKKKEKRKKMSFVIVSSEKCSNSCFKNIINVNSVESLRISWGIGTKNRREKKKPPPVCSCWKCLLPCRGGSQKAGKWTGSFLRNSSARGDLKPHHVLTPRCDEKYPHPPNMPADLSWAFLAFPVMYPGV